MIIVLSPLALGVILDVAVIVTTLSRAFVDAHAMQMVRHALQGRILVLQEVFLLSNLFF